MRSMGSLVLSGALEENRHQLADICQSIIYQLTYVNDDCQRMTSAPFERQKGKPVRGSLGQNRSAAGIAHRVEQSSGMNLGNSWSRKPSLSIYLFADIHMKPIRRHPHRVFR